MQIGGSMVKAAFSALILVFAIWIFCDVVSVLFILFINPSQTNQIGIRKSLLTNLVISILKLAIVCFYFSYIQGVSHLKIQYQSFRKKYNEPKSIQQCEQINRVHQSWQPKLKNYVDKREDQMKKNPPTKKKVSKSKETYSIFDAFNKEEIPNKNFMRKLTSLDFSDTEYLLSSYQKPSQGKIDDQINHTINEFKNKFNKKLSELQIENQQESIRSAELFITEILSLKIKQSMENRIQLKTQLQQFFHCQLVWTKENIKKKLFKDKRQLIEDEFLLSNNKKRTQKLYQTFSSNLYKAYQDYSNEYIMLDDLISAYMNQKVLKLFRKKEKYENNLDNKRKIMKIFQLIQKQILLDKQLNNNRIFRSAEERQNFQQQTSQIIKKIMSSENIFKAQNFKNSKFFHNNSKLSKFFIDYFINQLNQKLSYRLNTKIYLYGTKNDPQKSQVIFKIKLAQNFLLHYQLFKYQKKNDKIIETEYFTKPGIKNIFSLFMFILNDISQRNFQDSKHSFHQIFDEMQF